MQSSAVSLISALRHSASHSQLPTMIFFPLQVGHTFSEAMEVSFVQINKDLT
jgi:hypothetical protein